MNRQLIYEHPLLWGWTWPRYCLEWLILCKNMYMLQSSNGRNISKASNQWLFIPYVLSWPHESRQILSWNWGKLYFHQMEDRRNGDANQQSLRLVTGIPKPVKYLVVATKKKTFQAKCSLDRQNTWPLWLRMIRISIYLIKVAQKSPLLKVD